MPVPSTVETRVRANDARLARNWLTRWRLAVLATAVGGTATGLALAWTWMDGGLFLVVVVIAGPCIAACLFWLLFNDAGRDKTVSEPTETSEWEMRIRPQFPRDEKSEIDLKRKKEGDEA